MPAELFFAPEVEPDLTEAYDWYEGHRAGLGEEFLSCVDACIQAICRNPEMHATVHADYRRGLVRTGVPTAEATITTTITTGF